MRVRISLLDGEHEGEKPQDDFCVFALRKMALFWGEGAQDEEVTEGRDLGRG